MANGFMAEQKSGHGNPSYLRRVLLLSLRFVFTWRKCVMLVLTLLVNIIQKLALSIRCFSFLTSKLSLLVTAQMERPQGSRLNDSYYS